ncbi:MAG: hypothetical protein P8X63_02200 [Desulfuromonadaceae bacterium]|jgi:hypothetical protein
MQSPSEKDSGFTQMPECCPLFLARLLRNSRPKFRGLSDLKLK